MPSFKTTYLRHRPSLLVLGSQISAAIVNGLAKHIESGTDHVHPLQVLSVRLFITGSGSMLYLVVTNPPGGVWGPKEQRGALLIRAISGICGAVGFYFSILHLTLVEATALNFLAPLGSILLAKHVFGGSFTWVDIGAALASVASVIFALQPQIIFAIFTTSSPSIARADSVEAGLKARGLMYGIIGVMGGLISLTAIRYIGTKAHPMIGVNYFAWAVTAATMFSFLIMGELEWVFGGVRWLQMCIVGLLGLAMEFLLAAGLSSDPSATATVMIYSQIVWAALIDRFVYKDPGNIFTWIGTFGVIICLSVASLAQGSPQLTSGVSYVPINGTDDTYEVAMEEGELRRSADYPFKFEDDGEVSK